MLGPVKCHDATPTALCGLTKLHPNAGLSRLVLLDTQLYRIDHFRSHFNEPEFRAAVVLQPREIRGDDTHRIEIVSRVSGRFEPVNERTDALVRKARCDATLRDPRSIWNCLANDWELEGIDAPITTRLARGLFV